MSSLSSSRDTIKKQPPDFSSLQWHELPPEVRIKDFYGGKKWGWVVYRCSYDKELDTRWEDLKRRILENLRKQVAASHVPPLINTMDFIFVEDPALEGATNDELRARFQAWVPQDCPPWRPETWRWENSRHDFFLKVDGDLLHEGNVGLIQGWILEPRPEDCRDEDDMDPEDWFKVRIDDVGIHLYDELDTTENYYHVRSPPETGPVPLYMY
ncbi:uncharacterized protein J7T54_000022 [Emericellopsis cladophorae]|uniref:Uncharacterized protein n=1 Tax=Emericellopsis cladophorae TaxID=2686198 RepID=A0A9P9XUY5_9HYPO|nr:uncharacterized protein J7T54_000022 [Emericellopsis cladophorae]KAI6777884.1 hypothetical protein J7T54_000022 [Emericellopsis cladophorae]